MVGGFVQKKKKKDLRVKNHKGEVESQSLYPRLSHDRKTSHYFVVKRLDKIKKIVHCCRFNVTLWQKNRYHLVMKIVLK